MKKAEKAVPNHRLRAAREDLGWTQEELAEKIGTSVVTICRWETGVTAPRRAFHRKLSSLYGKSLAELGLLSQQGSDSPLAPPSPYTRWNFFHFNEPLLDTQEHFGRRQEYQTLYQRTLQKGCTAIIGPHRIGKTWLVRYFQLLVPAYLGKNYRYAYLDAMQPSCQSISGLVRECLSELQVSGYKGRTPLLALEQGLKQLHDQQITPILCIDEFEAFQQTPQFSTRFFRALRALTQKYHLVLITVCNKPLTEQGKAIQQSGLNTIFEQITLYPFNTDEASEFIQQKSLQARLDSVEQDALWYYGQEAEKGWPPLRLQLSGKLLLQYRSLAQNDPNYWQHFRRDFQASYQTLFSCNG